MADIDSGEAWKAVGEAWKAIAAAVGLLVTLLYVLRRASAKYPSPHEVVMRDVQKALTRIGEQLATGCAWSNGKVPTSYEAQAVRRQLEATQRELAEVKEELRKRPRR